ncbi:MAG TPA: helix-turn-helix domain-containing protein [Thermoanaerobaculia bacterium]|nr:helix-turn-helix domain-containing protein [Thermoanaerobaculia bacterium]
MNARRVVVIVVPPVEELDLVGPLQVFSAANRLSKKRRPYQVEVVTTATDRMIDGEAGIAIIAHRYYRDAERGADSLLLVCGTGSRHRLDGALFAWLRKEAGTARRVGGVCVASFLLARAGLLAGRRATVHWKYAHELARCYPDLSVDPEPIWIRDGNVYTSSGFTAGIDLALAWVEEDCGSALVREISRELVLFLRRPAAQPQLSISLEAQASDAKPIQELRGWIVDHLASDLATPQLARRVAMSERHFTRVFKQEVGTTPARYVLHLRVEAARRQLANGSRTLHRVARAAGFGSANVMRRAFYRVLGKSPRNYRSRPATESVPPRR